MSSRRSGYQTCSLTQTRALELGKMHTERHHVRVNVYVRGHRGLERFLLTVRRD
jgi:hypothetical protein